VEDANGNTTGYAAQMYQISSAHGGRCAVEVQAPSGIAAEAGTTSNFNSRIKVVGPELISQVPLVETVPGAPDASVQRINIKVGAARGSGRHAVYYGTVPSTCPKGGFTVRTALTFAGIGGLTQQTVNVQYTAPCPRR